MKTRFKMILYLVALLCVVVSFAWIASERNLATLPLLCLGLAMLVLPVWADSIRDDIEMVTTEEARYYLNNRIRGKYIEKRGELYLALVIDKNIIMCKYFFHKRDCIKWLDGGCYKEVDIE